MDVIDAGKQFCDLLGQIMAQNQDAMLDRLNAYWEKTEGSAPFCSLPKDNKVWDLDSIEPIITNFNYAEVDMITSPVLAYDDTIVNDDPNVNVSTTVSYSKSLTEAFSFSFKEAIKIGGSVKVEAGLPLIGQSEVTISGEISFEASQTWTKTETRVWSGNTTVNIAAGHSAQIKVIIFNAKLSSPFTADMFLSPKTWMMFYPVRTDGSSGDTWIPVGAIYTLDELKQAAISLSGNFKGIEGVSVNVEVIDLEA